MSEPDPIHCLVESVILAVGRPDVVLIQLTGVNAGTYQFDATAEVTVREESGSTRRKVTIGQLFEWLAAQQSGGVGVVLHPLTERYGLSLKTDFYVPGA